jgi:hypothetical protein
MQAHDLIGAGRRLVLDDFPYPIVVKILDKLSSRAFILDHDLIGIEDVGLRDDRALELGVVETPAEDVD